MMASESVSRPACSVAPLSAARSHPAARAMPRPPTLKARLRVAASGAVSATGMATATWSVRSASATEPSPSRISVRASPASSRPGFLLRRDRLGSVRRVDGLQHAFAWPAVNLETGRFLECAKRGAGLHAGLAVQLVLVEAKPRQPFLHRLDVGCAQLLRGSPGCRKRQWARHTVGKVPDEQHVKIREIVLLDDEVVLRGQECRAIDSLGLQQRGRLRPFGGTQPFTAHRRIARSQPFADRFGYLRHSGRAIDARGRFDLIGPAQPALPTLVRQLLCGRAQRIRHRMPEIDLAIAVEIDAVLVIFRWQKLRKADGAAP